MPQQPLPRLLSPNCRMQAMRLCSSTWMATVPSALGTSHLSAQENSSVAAPAAMQPRYWRSSMSDLTARRRSSLQTHFARALWPMQAFLRQETVNRAASRATPRQTIQTRATASSARFSAKRNAGMCTLQRAPMGGLPVHADTNSHAYRCVLAHLCDSSAV